MENHNTRQSVRIILSFFVQYGLVWWFDLGNIVSLTPLVSAPSTERVVKRWSNFGCLREGKEKKTIGSGSFRPDREKRRHTDDGIQRERRGREKSKIGVGHNDRSGKLRSRVRRSERRPVSK